MGGADEITVDLGKPRATLKIYDPTIGTSPSSTSTGMSSVQLKLSDHPMIVEL
jgi:hypothetical protein